MLHIPNLGLKRYNVHPVIHPFENYPDRWSEAHRAAIGLAKQVFPNERRKPSEVVFSRVYCFLFLAFAILNILCRWIVSVAADLVNAGIATAIY